MAGTGTSQGDTFPGPVEAASAFWRWLRRMRTALYLLGALGVAVLIGTVVPQRPNVPDTVVRWQQGVEGPGATISELFETLGFFDVFGAPWFLLILVLLFTSLTACLIPRVRAFVRMVRRGRPPRAIDLDSQPLHARLATTAPPDEVLAIARTLLRERRFRVRDEAADDAGATPTRSDPALGVVPAPADVALAAPLPGARPVQQVAAEKGHLLREGGSLIFHLAFYVLLIGVVLGELTSFVGQVAVVEGEPGFSDTGVAYWTRDAGRWWDDEDHTGFQLDLERFEVDWQANGTPSLFRAHVAVDPGDGRPERREPVAVNVPMVVNGMKVHVLDWGYAVRVLVRDEGEVVHDASIPLHATGAGVWSGALKAPAADPQLGLQLDFFADAPIVDGIPVPTGRPQLDAPALVFEAYQGDLRLDRVQNVNTLDTTAMQRIGIAGMRPGSTTELPGGQTLEFTEVRRWAGFQVSRRPTAPVLLLAAVLILVGLLPALYAYRRRVWVTAVRDAGDGGTLVTIAGSPFQRPQAAEAEFDDLLAALRERLPSAAPGAPRPEPIRR